MVLAVPTIRPLWTPGGNLSAGCCCTDCPLSLDVTFAGIDGNPCGCRTAGAFDYIHTKVEGQDGTFNNPFTQESITGGNIYCVYVTTHLGTLGDIVRERHVQASGCTNLISTDNGLRNSIEILIWQSSRKIRRVISQDSDGFSFDSGIFAHPGTLDIGDSIPNVLDCAVGNTAASEVGTAVVSLP